MKKIIFFIISVFCALIIFLSCEKDENENDNDAPKVSEIKINWGDTIIHKGKIIYINVDTLEYPNKKNRIDTLVLPRLLRFSARFEDDRGLSTYTIRMFSRGERKDNLDEDNFASCNRMYFYDPKDSLTKRVDTALCMITSWPSIFGKKDTIVRQNDWFILDRLQKNVHGKSDTLPVREGIYNFNIHCADKSGKTSITVDSVYIIGRDALLKSRENP